MNAPLTYLPAYIGLFAALMLAVACNAFLDIQYGSFGFEMFFWGLIFGWTLLVGWRQHGQANESGPRQQKIVLLLGLVASVIVFIPMWGFPRAGLYMLVVLQASLNCVTTTRRQLHFGLLVSAVMVMFAAAHYRADWTMLFYLIPYIIAVVFTMVSEQISRRAQDIRQASLGNAAPAGQGLAIAAATSIILALGGLLYLATPQLTWLGLEWRYGQLTNIGFLGEPKEAGKSGQSGGSNEGQGQDGDDAGQGSGSGGLAMPVREAAAAREVALATRPPESLEKTTECRPDEAGRPLPKCARQQNAPACPNGNPAPSCRWPVSTKPSARHWRRSSRRLRICGSNSRNG